MTQEIVKKATIIIGSDNNQYLNNLVAFAESSYEKTADVLMMTDQFFQAHILLQKNKEEEQKEKLTRINQIKMYVEDPKNQELAIAQAIKLEQVVGKDKWFHIQKIGSKLKGFSFNSAEELINQLDLFGYIQRDDVYPNKVLITITPLQKTKYYIAKLAQGEIYCVDITQEILKLKPLLSEEEVKMIPYEEIVNKDQSMPIILPLLSDSVLSEIEKMNPGHTFIVNNIQVKEEQPSKRDEVVGTNV